MTDLRTAAQQALDALENAAMECADWGSYASEYFQQKHDLAGAIERIKDAASALRAALSATHGEQPAVSVQRTQEPVAYRHLHEDGWEYYDAPTGEDCVGCQALYAAPQPAVSEQRTTEWVGLTDEEREAAIDYDFGFGLNDGNISNRYVIRYARAIEARLREKNGGGV